MSNFEIFGLISSIILSASGIPQVAKTFLTGNTKALSTTFLVTWSYGILATGVYMVIKFGFDPAILANYGISSFCALSLLGMKLGRK